MISLLPQTALAFGAARAAESRRFARMSPFQRRFTAQTAILDGEAFGDGCGGAA